MEKNYLFYFLGCMLFFTSCVNEIEKIYTNRKDLLQTFEGVSVIRRGKVVSLTFYKDSMHNDFIFEEINEGKGQYHLIRDSIQFDLKQLEKDNLINEDSLRASLQLYLGKMTEYNLTGVSSDFRQFGVALKLYLNEKEVLYVPDIKALYNKEWIDYIKSANKIDENWYWREYEHE